MKQYPIPIPMPNPMRWPILALGIALTLSTSLVSAAPRAQAAIVDRGITIREAQLYLAPDTTSSKLGELDRGREVVVLESSRDFLHVSADLTDERTVTGWLFAKGVIRTTTPDGDKIVFGEAVDSEAEGTLRHGRKGAAQDALRLYARMAEYFPTSSLAFAQRRSRSLNFTTPTSRAFWMVA